MSDIEILNQSGEKVGSQAVSIPKNWKPRMSLISEAVVYIKASKRQVLAHTLHRGEVRGGGKKPWRQKGTGRARVGSSRSPVWRAGGVVFGPRKNRNFKIAMTKSARRGAIADVLLSKIENKNIHIFDKIIFKKPSTKEFLEILSKYGISNKVLIVSELNPIFEKSVANVIFAKYLNPSNFNIHDLINYDELLVSKAAWDQISKAYLAEFLGKIDKKPKKKE